MGSVYFYFCPSRAVLLSAGLGTANSFGRRAPVAWGWGEGPRKVFSRRRTWPLCIQLQLHCSCFAHPWEGTPTGTEPCPSWGLESFPEATPKPRPWDMLIGAAGASRGGATGGWTGLGSVQGLELPRVQALWGGQRGGGRGRQDSHFWASGIWSPG